MGILSRLFGYGDEVVNEYCDGYEIGYDLREEHPELSEREQARLQVETSKQHPYHGDGSNEDAFYAFENGVYDGIVHNEPHIPEEEERPWWKIW